MNFPNSKADKHPWDIAFFMFPEPVDRYKGVPIHPNSYIDLWLSTCDGKKAVAKVITGRKDPMVQAAAMISGIDPEKAFTLLVEWSAEEFFAWLLRFPTTIPEEDWETLKLIVSRSINGTIEDVLEEAKEKNKARQEQIEKEASSQEGLNNTLRNKLEQLFYSNGDDHSSCL